VNKFTLVLAALTILGSCTSKDGADPSPAFSGQVQLTDEFGTNQNDRSGVLVTVADVSPQITTQTASDGTYHLSGVPDGAHTITYTKTGYGDSQLTTAKNSTGQAVSLATITLSQLTTTAITIESIRGISIVRGVYDIPIAGGDYVITGKVSPRPTATQPRPHRIYLQMYDYVLVRQPVDRNYDLTVAGKTNADGTFSDTIKVAQFIPANIRGETIAWITGDNPAASTFTDSLTKKVVYPANNLSINSKHLRFNVNY
jgi:hypothetical protein